MFRDCTRLLSDMSVHFQDTSTTTLKHQDSSLRVVLVMELTTQVSHLRAVEPCADVFAFDREIK